MNIYVSNLSFNVEDEDLQAFEGGMVTVLGTSLENKDILRYFMDTSWKAIGLEMDRDPEILAIGEDIGRAGGIGGAAGMGACCKP